MEIQTKLISIIIPVYNVENFISRCLDSLCNQTYPNFEVIMIDDGSTDNSYSIAKCYCEKDKRFKLFHQENSGQGSARNNGIKKAQGDYLAFVDSDDWVHPEFLEKMLCCAIANEADIVMCGVERVWENGIRRRNPISNQKEYIVDNKKEFLLHASFSSVDKIYRKDLLKGIEFAEKIKFEDFVFTPQVLEKASVIVGIPDVLYYYFWNISSTTNKVKINRDILKAHKKLEKTDFARNNPEIMSAYFVRMVIGSLIWALLHDYKNIKEVKSIMQYGKDIHNDLKKYITKENIGSVFWGNLVVHNRFFVAVTYTKLMSFLRNVGRPIYHKVISITKKYL